MYVCMIIFKWCVASLNQPSWFMTHSWCCLWLGNNLLAIYYWRYIPGASFKMTLVSLLLVNTHTHSKTVHVHSIVKLCIAYATFMWRDHAADNKNLYTLWTHFNSALLQTLQGKTCLQSPPLPVAFMLFLHQYCGIVWYMGNNLCNCQSFSEQQV